jgi:hypothetical protein
MVRLEVGIEERKPSDPVEQLDTDIGRSKTLRRFKHRGIVRRGTLPEIARIFIEGWYP